MSIYGALPLARKCDTQQEPKKKWRAGGFEMQIASRTLGMEFFIAFFPLLIYMHPGYVYGTKTKTWRHSHQHQHGQRRTNGAQQEHPKSPNNIFIFHHIVVEIAYLKMY